MTPAKARSARALIEAKTPLSEVAQSLGVGRATLYRWLERETTGPHEPQTRNFAPRDNMWSQMSIARVTFVPVPGATAWR